MYTSVLHDKVFNNKHGSKFIYVFQDESSSPYFQAHIQDILLGGKVSLFRKKPACSQSVVIETYMGGGVKSNACGIIYTESENIRKELTQ